MKQQTTRVYTHLVSSVFLAVTVLICLFYFVAATVNPHSVKAQTLTHYNQTANYRVSLMTIGSPPLSFIEATSVATLYLPLVFKNPQPSFWDDFSDEDSGWPVGTDSACESLYDGGRFRLNVDNDEECFRFAPPDKAERIYGSFEVSVYHSEGQNENALFGLYFNGNGGDEQYIFRINPNISTNTCSSGGRWELRRRWVDEDNDDEKRDDQVQRACSSHIDRGYGPENTNILRAKHTNDQRITLYINNQQVYTFVDTTEPLKGKGTGVYARAPSDEDVVIKFDDFKVYPPATSP